MTDTGPEQGSALPLSLMLAAAVVLPFLGIMGLTGAYSIHQLQVHTEQRMQEDIELIARAIRLPLSHALERGHERTVHRALESAFAFDRVYGVHVYDRDGEPIYSSGNRAAAMGPDEATRRVDAGQLQGEFAQAGSEEVFSYFVPLVDAGERITGLLQVTRRGREFDTYLADVRSRGLVLLALAGLLLTAVILLGHRWALGRHLRAMEHGMARVRDGELDYRLRHPAPRELQRIEQAINGMLDAIDDSRRALAAQQARERALAEKLHQSEKLAALGQLAAGVAHELGSPLSTIDGQAQRMLRRDDLAGPLQRTVEGIRREASRMARIINQLLDFGRANPLECRRLRAVLPLRGVLGRCTAPPGITIDSAIDPAAAEAIVEVDGVRLDQALDNLLSNALQAARSRVTVRLERGADGTVRYGFADDGPGVPAEARPHLFEPFFTTKATGQGTGLGLAVAHAAARDHGGRIEVDPAGAPGACFWLIIAEVGDDA